LFGQFALRRQSIPRLQLVALYEFKNPRNHLLGILR
jgi:hypothetical protein